jgi:hypothetical protein
MKPEKVELLSPSDSSVGVFIKYGFTWKRLDEITNYHIQISSDTLFQRIILDDSTALTNEIYCDKLNYNNKYYWRVRAKNENGWGVWSVARYFKTKITPEPYFDPPVSWQFERLTGENTAIILKKDINQTSGKSYLEPNDALGVFYIRDESLACGGYTIWDGNDNTAITAWGDNKQTLTFKDGFLSKENLRYKLWDAQNGIEKPVLVRNSSGPNYFKPDTVTEILSLGDLSIQKIILESGKWKYISSYILPFYPFLDSIFVENVIIIKSEKDDQYISSTNENTIGNWDNAQGYSIYSNLDDTLKFTGEIIPTNGLTFKLMANEWYLLPFLSDSPMTTEQAFQSIKNSILMLVNSKGEIYSPKYGIDNIQFLVPGEAYRIMCSEEKNFVYPNNQKVTVTKSFDSTKTYFKNKFNQTGDYSIFIVESDTFVDNDEVAIVNTGNEIVGCGIVKNRRCIFVCWGDNSITKNIYDGAINNESLKLKYYDKKKKIEKDVGIKSITDLLSQKPAEMKYKPGSISVVKHSGGTGEIEESIGNFDMVRFIQSENSQDSFLDIKREYSSIDIKIYNTLGSLVSYVSDGINISRMISSNQLLGNNPSGIYYAVIRIDGEPYFLKINRVCKY